MNILKNHLETSPTWWIASANICVFGVTMTEIEQGLKIVLLLASIALTSVSLWLKWSRRNGKPED